MTAENPGGMGPPADDGPASMRPRPMTAENPVRPALRRGAGQRFNEAAADDRGKLINTATGALLPIPLQ